MSEQGLKERLKQGGRSAVAVGVGAAAVGLMWANSENNGSDIIFPDKMTPPSSERSAVFVADWEQDGEQPPIKAVVRCNEEGTPVIDIRTRPLENGKPSQDGFTNLEIDDMPVATEVPKLCSDSDASGSRQVDAEMLHIAVREVNNYLANR